MPPRSPQYLSIVPRIRLLVLDTYPTLTLNEFNATALRIRQDIDRNFDTDSWGSKGWRIGLPLWRVYMGDRPFPGISPDLSAFTVGYSGLIFLPSTPFGTGDSRWSPSHRNLAPNQPSNAPSSSRHGLVNENSSPRIIVPAPFEEDEQCGICLCGITDPAVIEDCGHRWCHTCIRRRIDFERREAAGNRHVSTCPLCRGPITHLIHDFEITRIGRSRVCTPVGATGNLPTPLPRHLRDADVIAPAETTFTYQRAAMEQSRLYSQERMRYATQDRRRRSFLALREPGYFADFLSEHFAEVPAVEVPIEVSAEIHGAPQVPGALTSDAFVAAIRAVAAYNADPEDVYEFAAAALAVEALAITDPSFIPPGTVAANTSTTSSTTTMPHTAPSVLQGSLVDVNDDTIRYIHSVLENRGVSLSDRNNIIARMRTGPSPTATLIEGLDLLQARVLILLALYEYREASS